MDNPFIVEQYNFPRAELFLNKKVVIYGAGEIGRCYYAQFSRIKEIEIVAWVDQNSTTIKYPLITIQNTETLFDTNYDFIILAILRKKSAEQIKAELLLSGIPQNKIVWQIPLNFLD